MRIADNGSEFTIWASARDTEQWANRPGTAWPCSELSGRRFCATFDSNGLLDLTVDGRDDVDIDSHELSACVADLVADRIGEDHPCWFVVVGQFQGGGR